MARYIDEDSLIEEIKSLEVIVTGLRAGKGIIREYAKNYKESVLKIIEEQPTAYDVDAVVAELKKESYQEWCDSPKIVELNYAIDIVRNAGKEVKNHDRRKTAD